MRRTRCLIPCLFQRIQYHVADRRDVVPHLSQIDAAAFTDYSSTWTDSRVTRHVRFALAAFIRHLRNGEEFERCAIHRNRLLLGRIPSDNFVRDGA